MEPERLTHYKQRNTTRLDPKRLCFIIVDGADRTTIGLPHFVFRTKDDKGHALNVELVDLLDYKNPKKYFFSA